MKINRIALIASVLLFSGIGVGIVFVPRNERRPDGIHASETYNLAKTNKIKNNAYIDRDTFVDGCIVAIEKSGRLAEHTKIKKELSILYDAAATTVTAAQLKIVSDMIEERWQEWVRSRPEKASIKVFCDTAGYFVYYWLKTKDIPVDGRAIEQKRRVCRLVEDFPDRMIKKYHVPEALRADLKKMSEQSLAQAKAFLNFPYHPIRHLHPDDQQFEKYLESLEKQLDQGGIKLQAELKQSTSDWQARAARNAGKRRSIDMNAGLLKEDLSTCRIYMHFFAVDTVLTYAQQCFRTLRSVDANYPLGNMDHDMDFEYDYAWRFLVRRR